MAPTPTTLYANPETGELLPVVELGTPIETATRSEVNEEYNRLQDRYGLEPEVALKLAIKRVQETASAIAANEGEAIVNGGYRQTRMVG